MLPAWYGQKYTSFSDLEAFAATMGAVVGVVEVPGALYVPAGAVEDESPPLIMIPESAGPLERLWLLAHEVGHLAMHFGSASPARASKVEAQADRWAARALIPEAAVQRYKNASVDAFIGALSKHYEDLPLMNCRSREVAGIIARIRLSMVEERKDNSEEAV
jgi:Zn-dependent peptidase ImmA (M78 family)